MEWTRRAFFTTAVLLATVATGVAADDSATKPASTVSATQPDTRPVIKVATVEELLKAVGPERILELAPVEYRLSDAKRGVSPYFKWVEAMQVDNQTQYALVIRNCDHLTLRSAVENKPAHLVMGWAYSDVLRLEKCNALELVNLKLGHAPDIGECGGGVVKATDCNTVTLRKCDLYGCGTLGLDLTHVEHLLVADSVIHDCSYGIISAEECNGMRFSASTLRGIKQGMGFDLRDCTKIDLADCIIEDIRLERGTAGLFATNLSDPDLAITITGGAIRNNIGLRLSSTEGMVKLDNVKLEGNSWGR